MLKVTKAFGPDPVTAGQGGYTLHDPGRRTPGPPTRTTSRHRHGQQRPGRDRGRPGRSVRGERRQHRDCTFATIDAGDSKLITVDFDVPATTNAGTVNNSATATSDEDSDTGLASVPVNEDVCSRSPRPSGRTPVTAGQGGYSFTILVEEHRDLRRGQRPRHRHGQQRPGRDRGRPGRSVRGERRQRRDCTFATIDAGDSKLITVDSRRPGHHELRDREQLGHGHLR